MISNLIIAYILLLVSIRLYFLYRVKLNPGISKFYFCLMAWAICKYIFIIAYILKNIFSLIVYVTVFSSWRKIDKNST